MQVNTYMQTHLNLHLHINMISVFWGWGLGGGVRVCAHAYKFVNVCMLESFFSLAFWHIICSSESNATFTSDVLSSFIISR